MFEKLSKILIPVAIVVAGTMIGGALVFIDQTKDKETTPGEQNTSSYQQIAEKAINYINTNKDTLTGGNTASLISVVEDGEILKLRLKVGEREYDSYATKDGKFLFPEAYTLEEKTEEEATATPSSPETPKQDRPDVKLFVMSYCPFGLQAQKMFLPVYNILKEKAEMGVYFVDYIMHEKKEIDENLNQYCIQKNEKEKYADYLSCFVGSGDSGKCLSQAKIDKTKLTGCISETDAQYKITSQYNDKSTWLNGTYPKFDIYSDLNEKYGVQGSPTIVVNDKIVSISSRSPEKFKEVVCQAFNSPPEECSQALSETAPSSGIGAGTEPSSGGSCE